MSVGYRPAPYTVPPARRGPPAAAPRLRAAAHRLDPAARGPRPVRVRRRAGLVGDPAGRSRLRRRPHGVPEEALPQRRDRAGARRGGLGRSTTGCCGPTRRCSTCCRSRGLVAVLSPLGSTINGSHSWIVLPAGFSIQPSRAGQGRAGRRHGDAAVGEARRRGHPARRRRGADARLRRRTARLVMLQPDLGTALVHRRHRARRGRGLRRAAALGGRARRWAPCCSRSWPSRLGVLKDYQLDRFPAFYDPSADPQGHRLQRAAGPDRDRLGRLRRPGPVPRRADPGQVRARRSRPTSSSPSRGRSSASSAPARSCCCSAWCSGGPAGSR